MGSASAPGCKIYGSDADHSGLPQECRATRCCASCSTTPARAETSQAGAGKGSRSLRAWPWPKRVNGPRPQIAQAGQPPAISGRRHRAASRATIARGGRVDPARRSPIRARRRVDPLIRRNTMGKASRRKRQQRSSSRGDRTHAAAAEVPAPNFDGTAVQAIRDALAMVTSVHASPQDLPGLVEELAATGAARAWLPTPWFPGSSPKAPGNSPTRAA
jgi:hypothetical protein